MHSLGRNIILIFFTVLTQNIYCFIFPLNPPYLKALTDKEEQKPTSPDLDPLHTSVWR